MLRNVGVHKYKNGYKKKCKHFTLLTKEEYATIIKNRIEAFVVQNKRIMNPLDDKEKHSFYLWIENPAGEMVACVRIIPPHHAYTYKDRTYPIWDKAWITDPTVSLFPVPQFSKANAYIWTPNWTERVTGCPNSIMDLYEDTHSIMMFFEKHMDGLRYLGTEPDEYGYDGFKWVYEPVPPTDANVIIGRFIESQTEPLVEAKATKAT